MNRLKQLLRHLVAPEFAVRLHAAMLIAWLIPGTIVTVLWLSSAVAWVSWMSLSRDRDRALVVDAGRFG